MLVYVSADSRLSSIVRLVVSSSSNRQRTNGDPHTEVQKGEKDGEILWLRQALGTRLLQVKMVLRVENMSVAR